jgi:N-acetylglucosamine-6-phosphate deacetylase
MIPRHDNPIWPQLANHRLTASLIADGFHLTREELITFYKAKGPDRIILVSDVTELAGMPPGQYDWNGKNIVMTHDGRLVYPEQEVLAGASFSLRYGIMNMMRLADCSLEEAFRLATVNPARLYGLDDRGELTPGKRADLIIFSIRDDKMIVHRTVVRGETVFSDQ